MMNVQLVISLIPSLPCLIPSLPCLVPSLPSLVPSLPSLVPKPSSLVPSLPSLVPRLLVTPGYEAIGFLLSVLDHLQYTEAESEATRLLQVIRHQWRGRPGDKANL